MGFLDFFRGSRDERIARQYIKALRDAGDRRRLEYDARNRAVVAFDERGNRNQLSYMGNLAREILAAEPAIHDAIYRRYALSAIDHSEGEHRSDYALVKSRLRVLLKDFSYPDYIWLLNQNDFPDSKQLRLVFEHLAGDVIACCIEERDQGLRFVREDDLAIWGVDAAKALSDAKANVCALPYTVSDPKPVRYVVNDDSFIASRFVNPRMFNGLAVQGEWVAVVPDRDTFFVADSEDLEAVAGLARLAMRQLEKGERIISALPFVLHGGRWEVVYEPPESLRASFSNVALQYRAKYWADFKTELEKDLLRRGHDIFVASLTLGEERGVEARFSWAVWSKDVDTILPAVDRLYFYDDERKPWRVALWSEVARVMGAEMQREPGLPERYRVESFPSAEQFVAMGARTA